MGIIHRIAQRPPSVFVIPDAGRYVHPRRFRDPKYAEHAEVRRRERRRARRRR